MNLDVTLENLTADLDRESILLRNNKEILAKNLTDDQSIANYLLTGIVEGSATVKVLGQAIAFLIKNPEAPTTHFAAMVLRELAFPLFSLGGHDMNELKAWANLVHRYNLSNVVKNAQ